MDKNTIVIGIDHGWANMKTTSHLFTSGVKEITTEPALYEDVLEWNGRFFFCHRFRIMLPNPSTCPKNFCFYCI